MNVRASMIIPLLLAALAPPARADARSWMICTPGALRSCHSISITTSAVMTGSVRAGTAIVITLANLQGSGLPNTSAQASGLYQVTFTGPLATPIPTRVANETATLTGPGASGSLAWRRAATTVTLGSHLAWLDLLADAGGFGLLGGCTGGTTTLGPITAQTCGPGAHAVFAFSIDGALDAGQLNNVFILAAASTGSASCYSDPSAVPFFGRACEDITPPAVVPEPLSIVLLGTGLVGVGAARCRRRLP